MNKTKKKSRSTNEVIEMIMRETREEIEAFMAIEDQIPTAFEYEDRVIKLCRSMGQKLIQGKSEVQKKGKNSKKNS